MFTLRGYQQEGITGVRDAFTRTRRVCYQLPTGGGKTVIFGHIAQQLAQRKFAVLILAHRSELVAQASRKLSDYEVVHGICQAGFSPSMLPVQVGSVQSVINRLDKLPDFNLIVLDEAHHAVSPSYQRVVERWPNAYVLGVTATPARLDGKGLGAVFQELVCGPQMRWLIDQGYLAKYRYLAPPIGVDLEGVATRMGDYATDQLEEAMEGPKITGNAIAHYRNHLNGAPSIAFCVSVAHAARVAQEFRGAGYNAANVDGTMDKLTRARAISGLRDGTVQVLTSCDLIGEGLDVPDCYGIISLRPTKSLTVFLQQAGRGLRPKSDGRDALFLDHVGNCDRHGLPADLRTWTLDGCDKNANPTTTCDVCFMTFARDDSPRKSMVCPMQEEKCPYLRENEDLGGSGARGEPVEVEGELVEYDPLSEAYLRPPWAGGLNIKEAKGFEYHLMVERANTQGKLEQIRRVRGYNRGWVRRVMEARARGRTAAVGDHRRHDLLGRAGDE